MLLWSCHKIRPYDHTNKHLLINCGIMRFIVHGDNCSGLLKSNATQLCSSGDDFNATCTPSACSCRCSATLSHHNIRSISEKDFPGGGVVQHTNACESANKTIDLQTTQYTVLKKSFGPKISGRLLGFPPLWVGSQIGLWCHCGGSFSRYMVTSVYSL